MAGIYVHIPFCKKRCTYCDFHFSTSFESYRKELIQAISCELILRKNEISDKIQTIYFGGGTPSILSKSELILILKTIKENFLLSDNIEVTLEANPDDINDENLILWKSQGVNRLSIGLQSFKESDLLWMNRSHLLEQAIASVKNAQHHGFKNISVDLMYGLPNLSLEEWEQHLKNVVDLSISHISAYCLTVEPKTALFQEVKKKRLITASDAEQSLQFELLIDVLSKNGFEQYEVSNFAKEENYARHNSNYWKGIPFIGVGPSAHSYNSNQRRWNVANNSLYYKNVSKNNTWFTKEQLSEVDQWNELILTGFRTKWGVSKEKIKGFGGFSEAEKKILSNYANENMLLEIDSAYLLSKKGLLFADAIAEKLFRLNQSKSLLL